MISGVNNSNSNLMQLLLSAMKNNSNTHATSSSSSLSKDDITKVGSASQDDKNGFLSCLQENFSKIDGNSDNQLSQDEIETYFKNNKPMGPPPGMFIQDMQSYDSQDKTTQASDSLASTEGNANKGKTHGKDRLQKDFSELDTNQDGMVSQEELAAATVNSATKANQSSNNNAKDVFASIFSNLNNSNDFSKISEQFVKKLSDAYAKQGSSSNLLSSVMNLAI